MDGLAGPMRPNVLVRMEFTATPPTIGILINGNSMLRGRHYFPTDKER